MSSAYNFTVHRYREVTGSGHGSRVQAEREHCMSRYMLQSHEVVKKRKQMDLTYKKGYGEIYSRKGNTGKAIILRCSKMHDRPCWTDAQFSKYGASTIFS